MNLVDYLVVLSTVGTVVFSWTYLLLGRNGNSKEPNQADVEERIMELMGKFRYLSANRLELLEKKTQELRKLISEANTVMSRLMVKMSEIERERIFSSEDEGEKSEKMEKPIIPVIQEQDETKAEEKEEELETALERRIVSMYDRGFSEVDIAKKLGITVGEVRLILQLFKRNAG